MIMKARLMLSKVGSIIYTILLIRNLVPFDVGYIVYIEKELVVKALHLPSRFSLAFEHLGSYLKKKLFWVKNIQNVGFSSW